VLVVTAPANSYLGFILYDLFFKQLEDSPYRIIGVETRDDWWRNPESWLQGWGLVGWSF
jgi:hypothetical protein